MCRAVLPRQSHFEHWLLAGAADRNADGHGKEAALVEDSLSVAGDEDATDFQADAPEDTDGTAPQARRHA